jgi:flagellar biosynthesis/type III secretory pathway protein FliH
MTDKKKFLFDLNNFDEHEDEISEEELAFREKESELLKTHATEIERIKKQSYEQGKKDGYEDSRQSLEQKITLLLERSKHGFLELQAAEQERERRYEEEANILALRVFKGIYPAWVADYGAEEVSRNITAVLERAANQKSIQIEVAPSLQEEMQRRLAPVQDSLTDLSFTVNAAADLGESDFRMKWTDGGAVRDSAALARSILEELRQGTINETEETLDDQQQNRHNEGDIQQNVSDGNPPDQDAAPPAEDEITKPPETQDE